MTRNKFSRRQFLKQAAAASTVTLSLGYLVAGCKPDGASGSKEGSGSSAASGKNCDDTSGLTEAEIKTRESLKYVEKTPDPAKNCANCSLYQEPKGGAYCGGCDVMKGPINPQGYCTAWAPKA